MKKIILLFAIATLFTSCAKMPQEKYDTAKHCLDSLKDNGAINTLSYYDLLDRMKNVDAEIERQNAILFKKYDVVKSALNYITTEARRFVITNDRPKDRPVTTTNSNNSNVIRLEVEINFDANQDALKTASIVDQAIRNDLTYAKLIRVKIIE